MVNQKAYFTPLFHREDQHTFVHLFLFCILGVTVGVGLFIILLIVAIYLFTRRRKNNKKKPVHASDNEYYVDGESEISKLNLINPHLRRRIEKSLLKDPEKLRIHKEIGSGNFGKVFSGQLLRSNKAKPTHVAVKALKGK